MLFQSLFIVATHALHYTLTL